MRGKNNKFLKDLEYFYKKNILLPFLNKSKKGIENSLFDLKVKAKSLTTKKFYITDLNNFKLYSQSNDYNCRFLDYYFCKLKYYYICKT